jgi:hypothetical protein
MDVENLMASTLQSPEIFIALKDSGCSRIEAMLEQ